MLTVCAFKFLCADEELAPEQSNPPYWDGVGEPPAGFRVEWTLEE